MFDVVTCFLIVVFVDIVVVLLGVGLWQRLEDANVCYYFFVYFLYVLFVRHFITWKGGEGGQEDSSPPACVRCLATNRRAGERSITVSLTTG